MKQIKLITISLLAGVLITGCDRHGNQTIIGTGDVESMEVTLPAFDGVNVTGKCNVDIVIGEPQSVTLHAQSEVLEVMKYEVINGILQIGFKPDYSVKTDEEISAEITIPSVSYVGVTGAGDYILSGPQQDLLDIYITGTGNIKAFDMEVKECHIQISGAGNCEVNVSDKLDVDISGVGNVWYMGTPALNTDVSGVGVVTPVTP
jgi:hypothetical protein